VPMTADIVQYIAANIGTWIYPDSGSNTNGNIFESFRPSEPDRCVSVYELAGKEPKRTLGNNYAWEEPRLQIISRASSGDGWGVAQEDAKAIWNLLKVVVNQTVNGIFYMVIQPIGNPEPNELDPNGRPLYVSNFSVMKYFDPE
jgi:hypothetical protein